MLSTRDTRVCSFPRLLGRWDTKILWHDHNFGVSFIDVVVSLDPCSSSRYPRAKQIDSEEESHDGG